MTYFRRVEEVESLAKQRVDLAERKLAAVTLRYETQVKHMQADINRLQLDLQDKRSTLSSKDLVFD